MRGVVRGVVVFCDSLGEIALFQLRYVAATGTHKKKVLKKNGIMKFIFKLFVLFVLLCSGALVAPSFDVCISLSSAFSSSNLFIFLLLEVAESTVRACLHTFVGRPC